MVFVLHLLNNTYFYYFSASLNVKCSASVMKCQWKYADKVSNRH